MVAFVSSLMSAQAGKIKDGYWNGKPWDKEKLEKGVADGDVDALAEWAYCSGYCINNTKYNPNKIYECAKKASEGGSAFGTSMLGRCYSHGWGVKIDAKKGQEYFKKGKEQGHPYGKWRHHVHQRLAGKEKPQEAFANIEQCIKSGLLEANWSLASIYHKGDLGEIDIKKAGAYYALCLNEKCKSLDVAMAIYSTSLNDPILRVIPKESLDIAKQLIDNAAENEHIYCKFLRALKAMIRGDNFHQYLPDLVELAKRPYQDKQYFQKPFSLVGILIQFAETDRYQDSQTNTPYLVINNMSRSSLMKQCYDEGSREHLVHAHVVNELLKLNWWQRKERATAEEEAKAVEILRGMFIKYPRDHLPHHAFGEYYCLKYRRAQKPDQKDIDRALAHYIYHVNCVFASYKLAEQYIIFHKTKDYVRGSAALDWVIKIGERRYMKKAAIWRAKLDKEMTDEQKAAAKQLVKEGFPTAEKFRMKAFLKLQEIGDLPKTFRFDNREEDDGTEEEEARLNLKKEAEQTMVMFKPDLAKGVSTPQEKEVFNALMVGKNIADEDMPVLVSILVGDDEKLNALIESTKGGAGEQKAMRLKSIMGKEHKLRGKDSPIPAEMGWYVTHEKGEIKSAPLITKLLQRKKGSTVKVSDVLYECYGVSLARPNSRNLFMRLVHTWPKDKPLKLRVRRSPSSTHPGWQGQKNLYTDAVFFVE